MGDASLIIGSCYTLPSMLLQLVTIPDRTNHSCVVAIGTSALLGSPKILQPIISAVHLIITVFIPSPWTGGKQCFTFGHSWHVNILPVPSSIRFGWNFTHEFRTQRYLKDSRFTRGFSFKASAIVKTPSYCLTSINFQPVCSVIVEVRRMNSGSVCKVKRVGKLTSVCINVVLTWYNEDVPSVSTPGSFAKGDILTSDSSPSDGVGRL